MVPGRVDSVEHQSHRLVAVERLHGHGRSAALGPQPTQHGPRHRPIDRFRADPLERVDRLYGRDGASRVDADARVDGGVRQRPADGREEPVGAHSSESGVDHGLGGLGGEVARQ